MSTLTGCESCSDLFLTCWGVRHHCMLFVTAYQFHPRLPRTFSAPSRAFSAPSPCTLTIAVCSGLFAGLHTWWCRPGRTMVVITFASPPSDHDGTDLGPAVTPYDAGTVSMDDTSFVDDGTSLDTTSDQFTLQSCSPQSSTDGTQNDCSGCLLEPRLPKQKFGMRCHIEARFIQRHTKAQGPNAVTYLRLATNYGGTVLIRMLANCMAQGVGMGRGNARPHSIP